MDSMEQALKEIADLTIDMRAHWVNYRDNTPLGSRKVSDELTHFMCAFAKMQEAVSRVINSVAVKMM